MTQMRPFDTLRSVLKAFRHEVVVHEPEIFKQGKALRVHRGCRPPRHRLSNDGLDRFARSALHTFYHVVLFRFLLKWAMPNQVNVYIVPHFIGLWVEYSVEIGLPFLPAFRGGGGLSPRPRGGFLGSVPTVSSCSKVHGIERTCPLGQNGHVPFGSSNGGGSLIALQARFLV